MKTTISELWNNYVLTGKRTTDEGERKLLENMDKYYEDLKNILGKDNVGVLDTFIACYDSMVTSESRSAFIDGFILGARIIMEIK